MTEPAHFGHLPFRKVTVNWIDCLIGHYYFFQLGKGYNVFFFGIQQD